MNVYDFDGTVYSGDSSIDFYLFCIKKKPSVFLKSIFTQIGGALLYYCKRIPKEKYKEKYFSFVKHIEVNADLLNEFWDENSKNIKKWYQDRKNVSDVIISASPDFLLQPICDRFGVSLIASKVDPSTGVFSGKNCYGNEKVIRFFEKYPEGKIDEFYTDSKSDFPLVKIAEKAYLVNKSKIELFH